MISENIVDLYAVSTQNQDETISAVDGTCRKLIKCSNCKVVGHTAKDCRVRIYKFCNKWGHVEDYCWSNKWGTIFRDKENNRNEDARSEFPRLQRENEELKLKIRLEIEKNERINITNNMVIETKI